jgi:Ni,Fe-hydrogenase I small subunit
MTEHRRLNLLWLQSGGCGGCTLSLLCAESPDILTALEAAGIHLLWHPSLSEASGDEFRSLLEQVSDGDIPLDILCLEGAVVRGPGGSGRFHMLAGTGKPMMAWIDRLAGLAEYVVAVGSCAATAASPRVASILAMPVVCNMHAVRRQVCWESRFGRAARCR